jgi:hypothetical protein
MKPDPTPKDTGYDPMREICNAILRLRAAFKCAGMDAPVLIELGKHEDGDRLRYVMPRDMLLAQPQITDKPDPEWVCNIVGMEVRYPGRWRARQRGGRDFV